MLKRKFRGNKIKYIKWNPVTSSLEREVAKINWVFNYNGIKRAAKSGDKFIGFIKKIIIGVSWFKKNKI